MNSIQCAHCGKAFVRVTDETPLVNRSDGKSFHLTLFAGPYWRQNSSGDFSDQIVCDFAYAHDGLNSKSHTVVVIVVVDEEEPEQVLRQKIERAADELAEVMSGGQKLEAVYTLDGGEIVPGFPR